MNLESPFWQTISCRNKCAMCEASTVLPHGIKCVIFENLSTTTKTISCFLKVQGRPSTNSMLRCSHDAKGVGKERYSLVFCFLHLATWGTWKLDTTHAISHLTFNSHDIKVHKFNDCQILWSDFRLYCLHQCIIELGLDQWFQKHSYKTSSLLVLNTRKQKR